MTFRTELSPSPVFLALAVVNMGSCVGPQNYDAGSCAEWNINRLQKYVIVFLDLHSEIVDMILTV